MPEISVLVPVYNAEKYLEHTLNQIINQTFKDIEIICVNDGSTDKSPEILQNFEKTDKRIKIISHENRGVSAARDTALEAAAGKYIYFCDADDYPELTCLEKIFNKAEAENSDIVVFGYNMIDSQENKIADNSELLSEISKLDDYTDYKAFSLYYTLWDKLFRRDFIVESHIKFEFNTCEDSIFCLMLLNNNPKISIMTDVLYNYRGFNSSSQTNNDNYIKRNLNSVKAVFNKNNLKKIKPRYIKFFADFFILASIGFYNKYGQRAVDRPLLREIADFLTKNVDNNTLKSSLYFKQIKDYAGFVLFNPAFFSFYCDDVRSIFTVLGIKISTKLK